MIPIHITDDLRRTLADAFNTRRMCRMPPLPCSATAFLTLEMLNAFQRTVVLITNSQKTQDEMHRNLMAFADGTDSRILYYPAWETLPSQEGAGLLHPASAGPGGWTQPDIIGDRLNTLNQLRSVKEPVLVVTCIQALMQLTLAPDRLQANTLRLAVQEEHDPQRLIRHLEQTGYEFVPEVQFKGQATLRGGILDVWPLSDPYPSRIEFFGATVDTIRSFDAADQRSFTRQTAVLIPPADEKRLMRSGAQARCTFMQYLPAETIYFWSEPWTEEGEPDSVPFPEALDKLGPEGRGNFNFPHPSPLPLGGEGISSPLTGEDKSRASRDKGEGRLKFLDIELSTEQTPGASGPHHFLAIESHAATYEEAPAEARATDTAMPFKKVRRLIADSPRAWQCFSGWEGMSGGGDSHNVSLIDAGFRAVSEVTAPRRHLFEPDLFEAQRRQWLSQLDERAKNGMAVHLFFSTPGALDRFHETHPDSRFQLHLGALSDGFMHEAMRVAVISETNLIGFQKWMPGRYDPLRRQRAPRRRPAGLPARPSYARHSGLPPTPRLRWTGREGGSVPAKAGEAITDWLSIEPGDLVVHVDHGIGKYLGLYEIEFHGKLQEALAIEYADKAKLYVPLAQTHLLSRYIGVGKHHATMHRLGGKRWFREKAAAEQAVRDLAASLLETQALRESMEGIAFPPDTPWQHEFEAAFPYQETDDQEQAFQEVKRDMESVRPMDRLVCGDVGYGKTEVAMRASFKAVMAGKQVALLVPTTVLAQQHYEVFIERMSAYPIRVELLCRFRTPSEQSKVVRGLAAGTVDIVIGTHRLLQSDVQFKDLGLVIIDEEQRFGVAHKEHLKQVKQLVDVLTLTATPIPRTLYMSLTGARDISMIQTPPKARLPIETRVVQNEDHVVREAILRELSRGGQVYYLHNRVMTIERVRERLQRLAPEARIGIVHGQMPTTELARVMHDFSRGKFALLLCTTIIESGVDIPNVNTILIDRADRFGMADLYQLRGRVGRSARKAYAYLLLPVHGHLLDTPRRRIHAIMEHSDLGAGFRLAMRDLEIRGAGNLLGTEQSGHIAAIGFELYCQLLRRTITQMSGQDQSAARQPAGKGKPAPGRIVDVEVSLDFIELSANAPDVGGSAFLPTSYVDDERFRVSIYRKIASAVTEAEIQSLRDEFQDRFGPVPGPLDRLLKIAVLRMLAVEKRVTAIESKDGKIMFKRNGDYLMLKHQFPRLTSQQPGARLDELRRWLNRLTDSGFSGKA